MKKYSKIQLYIFIVLSFFLAFNFYYINLSFRDTEIPLFDIPHQIKNWSGKDLYISAEALSLIQPDNFLMREYTSDRMPPVIVYIGHYNSLDNSDRAHSPLVCYPGSGWEIKDSKDISFDLNGEMVRFTQMTVEKEDQVDFVLFGYKHDQTTTPALSRIRLEQTWHHILQNRSDSAFLRFSTNLNDSDIPNAQDLVKSFLKDFYPFLDKFFNNKE